MRYCEFKAGSLVESEVDATVKDLFYLDPAANVNVFMSKLREDPQSGHALANYIRQYCGQWLSEIGDPARVFYRGAALRTGTETAIVFPISKNRPPRDSSAIQNTAYIAMIKAAGGVANRYNSAFVTASKPTAATFGFPYVFMPIGDFHYTWSNLWKDWTQDLRTHTIITRWIKPDIRARFRTPEGSEDEYSFKMLQDPLARNRIFSEPNSYISKVDSVIVVDTGLPQAWQTNHEVMVSAELGLYIHPEFYNDLVKPFLLNPKRKPKLPKGKSMDTM